MPNKKSTYSKRRSKRPKRLDNRARGMILIILLAALALSALAGIGKYFKPDAPKVESPVSELLKVEIPDETPEIKIDYTGFFVSFNPSHHQPNYVAWELTRDEANGNLARSSKFRPDNDVYGCPTLDDYRNSGFDRGHMAPAGDMKWGEQAMSDSHYLTNMCPQSHTLNGGRWASLENTCREWARRDSAIIIICGPVLTDRMPRSIGESGVSVPERFFKVVLAPYANPPRAIGFIMPNGPMQGGIGQAATTVDHVEEITGFDFFSSLPDDVENAIESQANFNQWQRKRR